MTPAERQARQRERVKERAALAAEALAFLLTLEEAETYSMKHEKRRLLKDITMRGGLARLDAE